MSIQEDISKQIELGFSKDEILRNLNHNTYSKDEIEEAARKTNWSLVEETTIKGKIPKSRIITGVLLLLFAIDKLLFPHCSSFWKNIDMSGIYLFGLLFILTFFIKKI